jgi:chromosome segregation ATPase
VFRRLLLEHKKLRGSHQQLQDEMRRKDNAHNEALEKEKTEVSRLQQELQRVQDEKSGMELAIKQRDEQGQKQQELLDQTETRATSAEQALATLQAKCDRWLATLTRINNDMDSKFPLAFLFICFALYRHKKYADIT